jgi:predicted DNA-binding ribbon-helix-helix protein
MSRTTVLKRSVIVGSKKTSISLEDEFWQELQAIASEYSLHMSRLLDHIAKQNPHSPNLSSSIRLFVLAEVKARAGRLSEGD